MISVWHGTADARRVPDRVSAGERVSLTIGTWPIEPGQSVWVTYRVHGQTGAPCEERVEAVWQHSDGVNSYWRAQIGPFADGDRVTYVVYARSADEEVSGPATDIRIGPKVHLALVWHQHQPLYKDLSSRSRKGTYRHPWVRLHAIRDYYSMAALVARHPGVHLTINLTPVLLWQIEDYAERGATDRALELSLQPAEAMTKADRAEILATFFDAHWHNQIFPHPHFKELFIQRHEGKRFSVRDVRDLQMWFNLAWFAKEFRDGEVELVTGQIVSIHRFVEQGHGFSTADLRDVIAQQLEIMRAIIPLHRALQDQGQIEVSTTPYYHPILPLLIDTDAATIDRPGASYPSRFAHPEDAAEQVWRTVEAYQGWFGRSPRGMWPAEGAVSEAVIPLFARHGIRWIATDQGVLARSGRWGYNVDDPEVLCRPYRGGSGDDAVSIFFRDSGLADRIGFRYHGYPDYEAAAKDFLVQLKDRFGARVEGDDRVVTVVLDGENAWGAYREDARPFLHALYASLEADPEVRTVTLGEYLTGNEQRGIMPHPLEAQTQVYDLFTGSWIDENGSAPGVDLGTWIGEDEENRAWELLRETRAAVADHGGTPQQAPAAFEAVYAAEGSDWFWWFGADQDSGNDDEFDDLFRANLQSVYRALGQRPPTALRRHIVPRAVVWTFTRRIKHIQPRDRLTIRTNCPGVLTWQIDDGPTTSSRLVPAGGAMAGVHRYHVTLGPVAASARKLRFRFRCTHPKCVGTEICCSQVEQVVAVKS